MSLINNLYKISRAAGKTASALNNAKDASNGRFDKIAKREIKKQIFKAVSKTIK